MTWLYHTASSATRTRLESQALFALCGSHPGTNKLKVRLTTKATRNLHLSGHGALTASKAHEDDANARRAMAALFRYCDAAYAFIGE